MIRDHCVLDDYMEKDENEEKVAVLPMSVAPESDCSPELYKRKGKYWLVVYNEAGCCSIEIDLAELARVTAPLINGNVDHLCKMGDLLQL